MGISLGWVVLLLAGATGAPPAEKTAAPISYTVKMVEADGVGWRASAMSHLRPITRQGAATVWTIPTSAAGSLMAEIAKNSPAAVVQGPRVTAFPGVPATIQVRENRKFVTQVAWNGDESTSQGSPEQVRVGWHTTIVGRKLDQGILVKMVFEDTEIRGVYQVTLAAPTDAKVMKSAASVPGTFRGEGKSSGTFANPFEKSPFWTSSPSTSTEESASANKSKIKDLMDKATTFYAEGKYLDCEALARRALEVDPTEMNASFLAYKARTERRFKTGKELLTTMQCEGFCGGVEAEPVRDEADQRASFTEIQARHESRSLELPEIANQEILGEWLIPNGECLLVSFGPHTVADKAGKAVVRERLAFVEADEQPGVPGQAQAMTTAPKYIIRMAPTAPPPPAPFGAVPFPMAPAGAFAPNAPNGNTIYVAPFAPAPIGPSAGFAPTPNLDPAGPLPSGRYMHDDVHYMDSGPDFPWANTQAATQRARMRASGVEPPSTSAGAPTSAAPVRSPEKLPMPPAPSRSFPQGIHTDGSKALPPLPDDEKDDESADSESAEPRPSPQTKKPRKPEPEPKAETRSRREREQGLVHEADFVKRVAARSVPARCFERLPVPVADQATLAQASLQPAARDRDFRARCAGCAVFRSGEDAYGRTAFVAEACYQRPPRSRAGDGGTSG